jgi:hypothetical protein
MTWSKRVLLIAPFLTFLAEKVEDDRQSIASWGTGGTTYTEIITNKDMSETDTSSITQDTPKAAVEEINRRKALVRARFIEKNVTHQENDDIMNNKDPYQLAFSGVHLASWDTDKEVFLIMAIRDQYINSQK